MKLKLSIIVALIVATLFSCSLNQNNIGSVPVNVSEIYKQVREATGATNEQIKIVVSIEGDRGYKKNQTIEGLKSEEQIKQKTIFAEGIRIGETVVIDVKIYVQGKIKYSAHNSVKINSEKTKVLFAFVPVEQSTVPLDFVLV